MDDQIAIVQREIVANCATGNPVIDAIEDGGLARLWRESALSTEWPLRRIDV